MEGTHGIYENPKFTRAESRATASFIYTLYMPMYPNIRIIIIKIIHKHSTKMEKKTNTYKIELNSHFSFRLFVKST